MFHYGAWIWRIQPGGQGTLMAHEVAGHGRTGGSSSAAPKTVPVQQEPVEIHSEEETPPTGGDAQAKNAPVNPPLDKGKGKMSMKKAATTHPASKRKREESSPAEESLEELWVKLTLKLKELEEKLKRSEAHNRELKDLTARQLDEMANLSAIAGGAKAETLQLKEENLKLMEELESKEREFLGRARRWMEDNLVEAARVLTSSGRGPWRASGYCTERSKGKR
ncbi:unnamed protein product [Cuscuta campestris]|uniref:Uncharacterized protein n=1 Tax=Cuscuta campestris TaxID=132261 RepID=A0A484MKS3_9ASTE|nr:unnamed protein product [Cuscuta campestris]